MELLVSEVMACLSLMFKFNDTLYQLYNNIHEKNNQINLYTM